MWITEGFRKGDKVGRGKGQRSDLRDGGELLRSSGGKDGGRQGISGPWQGVNLRWVAEMIRWGTKGNEDKGGNGYLW